MPPPGGVRASLAGMVARLTNTRSGSRGDPSRGKGAPILSYSWNQPAAPGPGNTADITQFAPVFQPSGGLFAPGYPLSPVEYERLRRYDYPVGYNYSYTPRSYEEVSFQQLRNLARSHSITRLCIETRKDQIEALDWSIGPVDPEFANQSDLDAADTLQAFFKKPDGYTPFASWLRYGLEDLLVIDAPTLEIRRNRGGSIVAFDWIDGATIKPLLDDTGRRPRPPAPAFEQVIHGRPWNLSVDASAEADQGRPVYPDQIIYFPRNPRTNSPYGYSPVEQTILTVNTAIRREIQQLQWFTVGNVPQGTIDAPQGWTAAQIAEFQQWFDSYLEGNTGNRSKVVWIPPGTKYHAMLDAPVKDKFDEWLSRIVCFAFSLPPNAFVERINRATAETAQEAALEEGLGPLMRWVKRLMDSIIQDRFGFKGLEFQWNLPPELDPASQAKILDTLVKDGLYSVNEARDQLGLDPIEDGDEHIMVTGAGPILLKNILAGGTAGGPSQLPTDPDTGAAQQPATPTGDDPGENKQSAYDDVEVRKAIFDEIFKGHVDPAAAVPTTLPQPTDVEAADVQHESWSLVRNGTAEVDERTLPVAALTATQPVVDRDRVAADAAKWRNGQQHGFRPLVLAYDGKHYLLSGHHHVEGAKQAGIAEVTARVMRRR